jgi:hypothetical protein
MGHWVCPRLWLSQPKVFAGAMLYCAQQRRAPGSQTSVIPLCNTQAAWHWCGVVLQVAWHQQLEQPGGAGSNSSVWLDPGRAAKPVNSASELQQSKKQIVKPQPGHSNARPSPGAAASASMQGRRHADDPGVNCLGKQAEKGKLFPARVIVPQ